MKRTRSLQSSSVKLINKTEGYGMRRETILQLSIYSEILSFLFSLSPSILYISRFCVIFSLLIKIISTGRMD